MNWERVLLKLRWDPPAQLAARVLTAYVHPRMNKRRRERWSQPACDVRPEAIAANWTASAAQRLWPGAANRGWLPDAATRWPELHAEAQQRAANAAKGVFDLLGSGPTCIHRPDGGLEWHTDFKSGASWPREALHLDVPICLGQDGTDIKVPWELSRFQHVFAFVWTDPERYRDVFVSQWEDWVAQNPVARGVNWACAMDVGLRAISWTAALAAWGDSFDAGLTRRFGAVLATHGEFIRDNLEWIFGQRTNHYFSDIVGLMTIAAVLGDGYRPARGWARFAAGELRREILRQFGPDGFNRECSTAYHNLMLELALLGWRAAEVAGRPLGEPVRERLIAAARAVALLGDSTGNMPLIGDNDSGRVYPAAAYPDWRATRLLPVAASALRCPELAREASPESMLLCGVAGERQMRSAEPTAYALAAAGRALEPAGLYVLGRGEDYLLVRCGPTYPPAGTHKHYDQLSIDVSVNGRPLIVDPGQYCYTPWPKWQHHFMFTAAHNTVRVDAQEQGRVIISGRNMSLIPEWRSRCEHWSLDEHQAAFVGRHRGYRRLAGGADHVRTIRYDAPPRQWVITDALALARRHAVQWRFHLHPDARATETPDGWSIERDGARLLFSVEGAPGLRGRSVPAHYAPGYGQMRDTHVLEFEAETAGPIEVRFTLQVVEAR